MREIWRRTPVGAEREWGDCLRSDGTAEELVNGLILQGQNIGALGQNWNGSRPIIYQVASTREYYGRFS